MELSQGQVEPLYYSYKPNLPALRHHLIYPIWIRHNSVSVTSSALPRKSVSRVADEIIVYHVGMLSAKTSTKHSCNTLMGINLAELLQLCLPDLTGNGGIDGLRLSRTSTFHAPAGSMEYVKQCYW